MTTRPLKETVAAALETLVEADAVGLHPALCIAYEAGRAFGFDAGIEIEKYRMCAGGTTDKTIATTTQERPDGFYWVSARSEPEIARFVRGEWHIFGIEEPWVLPLAVMSERLERPSNI